jgi:hypothetical protein
MDLERRIERFFARWYKRTRKKPLLIALFALMGGFMVGMYIASNTSVVPKAIQGSVPFSIYYPANLPAGYKLDAESFRLAEPGVVLFTVTYGEGRDIVFSQQKRPSSSEMDKFIDSYIPLNTPLDLPLGEARIGAYGTAPNIRTAVSLPIHGGPWIIATAPSDINRDDLIKILESLDR